MSNEQNKILIDSFHGYCGMLLFSFAKHECDTKNKILRNFIARTDVMLKGIFSLWEVGDIQDCWIIHRCLLERLFHLHHISENNEFEQFDNWSFYQQYNANNKIASDREFKNQTDEKFLKPTHSQKERHKKLSKSPPKWKRPYSEDVAKEMNLMFFYKYGYDYASTHVHPMANDGLEDFYSITNLEPKPDFPDHTIALSNSILVATILIQEALNCSDFQWRGVTYSFLENMRKSVANSVDESYLIDFIKITQLFESCGLNEKKSA